MGIQGFLPERERAWPVDDAARAPDPSQAAVIDLPPEASAAVIGAPGTGKTTTLADVVADRVLTRGWSSDQILVLTTGRTTATILRDRLGRRLSLATSGPIARTVNSLAFDIVAHAARLTGAEPPRLLTGSDQDSDISQLLAGQFVDGTGPAWPGLLDPEVRRLRGFRTELRELMMRATEYRISPERLSELGRLHDRPEWVAAADFMASYLEILSGARPSQLDSAELVQFAIAALAAGTVSESVSKLRLILVDDIHEATKSAVSLIAALAARGIAVIAFGDPDVAANAFRGGEPDVLGRLGVALGIPNLVTMQLTTAHRHDARLREFVGAITGRIGSAGVAGHRSARGVGEARPGAIMRLEAATPAREWAAIARAFRERHLIDGVPWNEMAVVLRAGNQVAGVARALAVAEVPTRTTVGGTALRDDPAARSIATVLDAGIGRTPLTGELVTELLLGPFGSLDRLTLRRLRIALRAEEVAGDGHRGADELLVDAMSAPGRLATIDHRVAREAESLAQTLADVSALAAAGGTIEELLWLVWERSSLRKVWYDQSLGTGIAAAEANRNLDGILAVFTAANRFVEREPAAGPGAFLARMLDADVPEDTLSPRAVSDAVLVTTPPGVVGLEFDTVAVAGLQDGVWPNLRIRGSLLDPQALVRVATGIDGVMLDERKEVLNDELRMFALAVSRARKRVILSAVANEDEAASVFFALVPADAVVVDASSRAPLSLRGLTGRLRRELTTRSRSDTEHAAAASALARLAAEHVPGADPVDWHGLLEPSSVQPLFDEADEVPVSPSKLEAFEKSPLDWFIESVSGTQSSTAMGVGTIVHWAMETATDSSVDAVWSAIESRWQELVFESPWLAERQIRATRVLANAVAEYLGDFEAEDKTLIGAERRFSLKVDRARVNGSIDRVELSPDGGVVIVDLKTGAAITSPAEIAAHPQLGVYQLAYAEGLLDDALGEHGEHHGDGAKLLFVKKGKGGKLYREAGQAALDEVQLEGFRARIRQAAIGMAAASFSGPVELDQWGGGDTASRALHRVRAVSSD